MDILEAKELVIEAVEGLEGVAERRTDYAAHMISRRFLNTEP